jgi:hypothetical protein
MPPAPPDAADLAVRADGGVAADEGTAADQATPPSGDAGAPATDGGMSNPSLVWLAQSSGTTVSLSGIWGSAANDIYVVGENGTILHSDGSGTWTAQVSGTTEPLKAVWGSGPNDLHVVGGAAILNGVHLTSKGDGTWQAAPNPAGAHELVGVWGTSSSNYYLIGDGTVSHTTDAGLSWTTLDFNQPTSTTHTFLTGIWGDGTGLVLLVSYDTYSNGADHSGTRRLSRDDGASWTSEETGCPVCSYLCVWGGEFGMTAPSFAAFTESGAMEYINWVMAIWGSTDDVYQATKYGNLIHSKAGSAWVEESHGTPQPLFGLWGSSATDVYAVGAGGLILHRR